MALYTLTGTDFDSTIKQLLNYVPEGYDTREGSVLYNTLAPTALGLFNLYNRMSDILDALDPTTASYPALVSHCRQVGLTPVTATQAMVIARFDFQTVGGLTDDEIDEMFIDSSWHCETNNMDYTVQWREKREDGTGTLVAIYYAIQADNVGTDGNVTGVELIANDNLILAPIKVTIESVRDYAVDDEDAESLRARYYDAIRVQSYAGNIKYYEKQMLLLGGIGGVQVHPTWNGGGTVNVSVIDSDFRAIDDEKKAELQLQLDPSQTSDEYVSGVGVAPIDHQATLSTPTEISVFVTMTVELKSGYTIESVKTSILGVINNYFLELRQSWGSADEYGKYRLRIYTAVLTSRILANVDGVDNIPALLCTYTEPTDEEKKQTSIGGYLELNETLTTSRNVEIPICDDAHLIIALHTDI